MSAYRPFEVLNPDAKKPVILLCDHASNHIPEFINGGTLGLSDHDMSRHIAYDIGARGVTENLAKILDARGVVSNFSRLVIDPNRGEDDPTLLMKLYDGSIIEGNRHADAAEKARRLDLCYRPYHQAITDQINQMIEEGRAPCLVSIHSFTPQLRGRPKRPWHLGVLWDKDGRLALPFMEFFKDDPDVVVGNNEPYTGELQGDTMYNHGTARGIPHILIEVRHDLIETPETQFAWAERIASALWVAFESLKEENQNG